MAEYNSDQAKIVEWADSAVHLDRLLAWKFIKEYIERKKDEIIKKLTTTIDAIELHRLQGKLVAYDDIKSWPEMVQHEAERVAKEVEEE